MMNFLGAHGGPVIFILLISHLLKNSRELLNDLWDFMKELKVTDYENEDVHTMVYELRVNFEQIYCCVDAGTFCMLTDYMKHLIEVFQTLSCKKFNETFVKLETDMVVGSILKTNANQYSTFGNHTGSKLDWRQVLAVASTTNKLYEKDRILEAQEQGPGNHGFVRREAGKKKGPCHACGGDHWLCKCPNCQGNGGNQNQNHRQNQDGGRKDSDIVPPTAETCNKVSTNPNQWPKKVGNQTLHWCGKCIKHLLCDGSCNSNKGRWTNGNNKHFTDKHCGPCQGPRGGGGRGGGGRGGDLNHNSCGVNLASTPSTPSAPGTVASENDVIANLATALTDTDDSCSALKPLSFAYFYMS